MAHKTGLEEYYVIRGQKKMQLRLHHRLLRRQLPAKAQR